MGFFTPDLWKRKATPLKVIPECEKCGLYKTCKSPKLPVSGEGRRSILFIAEAPGKEEDEKGLQLIGNSGTELTKIVKELGVRIRRDCWITNALLCRPPRNAEPDSRQIGWCRPNLAATIKELQPDVIIPLGLTAIKSLLPLIWKHGKAEFITSWAGWTIPCMRINSWVCPTLHPSYLLQSNKDSAVPRLLLTEHLTKFLALKGKPYKTKPDYTKQVQIIFDPKKAAKSIQEYQYKGVPIAFDYETNMLKPHSEDARILCCSLSDGKTAIAFPWQGEAVKAMQGFLQSDCIKIGANIKFEEGWTCRVFGHGVNWGSVKYGSWDTLLGAHWLNCHKRTVSVKFQAFVRFGIEDYDSWLDDYKKSKSSNEPNRLHEVEPRVLLEYCGLDSLYEAMIAQDQRKEGLYEPSLPRN